MSKSGSFTVVLTVICLSGLMSLEADAQSTIDETNSCSSSSLDEVVNLIEIIALNQQQNAKEIKEQLAGNSSVLKEEIKKITSKSCESDAVEPSKQALVSALVSEFVVSYVFCLTLMQFYPTGIFYHTSLFNRKYDSDTSYRYGNSSVREEKQATFRARMSSLSVDIIHFGTKSDFS